MSENTELIPIVGTENDKRTTDIIFVHGLGGDALETWHPQGKKEAKNSWLTWLGNDFKDMGIWSVAYEVEPFRWKGSTMPLADRVKSRGERPFAPTSSFKVKFYNETMGFLEDTAILSRVRVETYGFFER